MSDTINKGLIIIGARALGREVHGYAGAAGVAIKGFLDSDSTALNAFVGYAPILGGVEDYVPEKGDVFVCAIGNPQMRSHYVKIVEDKGGRFVSIVHPLASIGANVRIGEGTIIAPSVAVTCDVIIGNHVLLNVGVSVNHDSEIGCFATLAPGCRLLGRNVVPEFAIVSAGRIVDCDKSFIVD